MRSYRYRGNGRAVKTHNLYALRVAADERNLVNSRSYGDTRVGNHHYILALANGFDSDEITRLFVELTGFYTLTRSGLESVFVNAASLAVTVGRNGDNRIVRLDDGHIDDVIAVRKVDRSHALGISAHLSDVFFAESDTLTFVRTDKNFVIAARELDGNKFVAGEKAYRDLSALSDRIELGHSRFLDKTELGRHHDVTARAVFGCVFGSIFGSVFGFRGRFGCFNHFRRRRDGFVRNDFVAVFVDFRFKIFARKFLSRNNRGDSFAVAHLNKVDDRPAPRRALGRFGDFVSLDSVNLAERTEEQQIVVRGAYEHILHKIFFLGLMSRYALSSATLSLTLLRCDSLDVTHMRHRNNDVLSFDKVRFADIRIIGGNLGFSRSGVSVLYIFKVVSYDRSHSFRLLQDIFEVGYGGVELAKFFVQLIHFHRSEPLKPHFKNGGTLFVVEKERRF